MYPCQYYTVTSLNCAECAHQLGWLRSQQTQLASLAQNHTLRQAPSTHRSCHLLVQHFWETLLTYLTQNHTQTGIICPSLALLARSALLEGTAHFACAEPPTQTDVICPSLVSFRITHRDRCHLPNARIARSFCAQGSLNYLN